MEPVGFMSSPYGYVDLRAYLGWATTPGQRSARQFQFTQFTEPSEARDVVNRCSSVAREKCNVALEGQN